MRVLHTADFHAGKTLRGTDRTPEIHDALQEIAALARSETADAVLVAGDLFDGVNPSAAAEQAVFEFFLSLKEAQIPSVVISGNHDSVRRLESLTGLLGWVGADMVAEPKTQIAEMVRRIETRCGPLVVGALPFLSERRMVKAADVWGGDVGAWRQKYREGMGFFLRNLGQSFDYSAVNMLMLHATFDGAVSSGSDRGMQFDLQHHYTLSPLQLPGAQYVALGHVHKPQVVSEAPLSAYSGSIIQLDFGEGGEQKQVNLIEVSPGKPARLHAVPLVSGKELLTVYVTPQNWEQALGRLEGFSGYARVVIKVAADEAVVGLKDRIMALFACVIAVEVRRAESEATAQPPMREGLSLLELYERYYAQTRGELPADIRALFEQTDQAVRGEVGESGAATEVSA